MGSAIPRSHPQGELARDGRPVGCSNASRYRGAAFTPEGRNDAPLRAAVYKTDRILPSLKLASVASTAAGLWPCQLAAVKYTASSSGQRKV